MIDPRTQRTAFALPVGFGRRLAFTLAALVVMRLGRWIPVPGIDPDLVAQTFAERASHMQDLLLLSADGAIDRISILSLGLAPYLCALVAVHLLARLLPGSAGLRLAELMPRCGRAIMSGTLVIAVVQALGVAVGLQSSKLVPDPGPAFVVSTVTTLTAGSLFLACLAEQVSLRGLGNGVLVLLAAGTVCQLPANLLYTSELVRQGGIPALVLPAIGLGLAVQVGLAVFVGAGRRRLLIAVPAPRARPNRDGPRSASLTFDLAVVVAGVSVFPAVFAYYVVGYADWAVGGWATGLSGALGTGRPLAIIATAVLIVVFTFYLTAFAFTPNELTDAIARDGGAIPSDPSSEATTARIDVIATRLTALAAAYLCFACILPDALVSIFGLPFGLGGYELLLVTWTATGILAQRPGR